MAAAAKKAVQRKKRPYKRKLKGGDAPLTEEQRQQLANQIVSISEDVAKRADAREQKALLEQERAREESLRKLQRENTKARTDQVILAQKQIAEQTDLTKLQQTSEVLDQARTVEDTELKTKQQRNTDINSDLKKKQITGQNLSNRYARAKQVTATAETAKNFITVLWNALKEIGGVLAIIGKQIKDFIGAIWKTIASNRPLGHYIALAIVIIVLFVGIGFLVITVKKKPTPPPKPITEQKPPAVEEKEGEGYKLQDLKVPSVSIPNIIPSGIGNFFDRIFPTYKLQNTARNIVGTFQPNLPPQETTKRERIAGRCDNIKLKETSLKSGEGGICTSEEIPQPIRWVIDSAKIPDYNMLPDQLKQQVTNNGTKNIITIPWKSDGFVYSPDCAKATYGDSKLANLLTDYNTEYCQKREVDKVKYDDAYRVKQQMSYYKGIDVFE